MLGKVAHNLILFHFPFHSPWNRLPLKIRWIEEEYYTAFPANALPKHMEIVFGQIKAQFKTVRQKESNKEIVELVNRQRECHLCLEDIKDLKEERVFCINPLCKLVTHMKCLAKRCLEPGHYVPIRGQCVLCDYKFLWNDIVRKKNGFKVSINYNNLHQNEAPEIDENYL